MPMPHHTITFDTGQRLCEHPGRPQRRGAQRLEAHDCQCSDLNLALSATVFGLLLDETRVRCFLRSSFSFSNSHSRGRKLSVMPLDISLSNTRLLDVIFCIGQLTCGGFAQPADCSVVILVRAERNHPHDALNTHHCKFDSDTWHLKCANSSISAE